MKKLLNMAVVLLLSLAGCAGGSDDAGSSDAVAINHK